MAPCLRSPRPVSSRYTCWYGPTTASRGLAQRANHWPRGLAVDPARLGITRPDAALGRALRRRGLVRSSRSYRPRPGLRRPTLANHCKPRSRPKGQPLAARSRRRRTRSTRLAGATPDAGVHLTSIWRPPTMLPSPPLVFSGSGAPMRARDAEEIESRPAGTLVGGVDPRRERSRG